MSKDAWKWILEEAMTDHELVKLANDANIKIQGFRQLSVDKTFHTLIRPKLLKTMQSRSFTKVQLTCNDNVRANKEWKSYRGKTLEELEFEAKKPEVDIKLILISLLSSPELENRTTGEDLFSKFQNGNYLEAYLEQKQMHLESQIEKQQKVAAEKQETLLEKKATDLEKTVKELTASNKKIKTEMENQRKTFEKERSDLQKELTDLKTKLSQADPEKAKTKLEQKQQEWELQRKNLQQKIDQQSSVIKNQKSDLERLDEEVRKLQSVLHSYELEEQTKKEPDELPEQFVTVSGEKATATPGLKVALIGKPERAKQELVKSDRFQIEFVEIDRLDQVLETGGLQDKEQIWYLEFETSMPKRRKLKGQISKDRLVAFENLLQLKSYIYQ